MNEAVFRKFQQLVYASSGITLREGKQTMLRARIAKRIRALDLTDERAYLNYLDAHRSSDEVLRLLEVVSTNLTSFFREPTHFDLLEKLATQWLEQGQRRIRVWSCASSTGEEPYTLGMVLHRLSLRFAEPDIRILATDISGQVLDRARAGVYEADRIAGIPDSYRREYFRSVGGGRFEVDPRVREMLVFKWLNLSRPPFPMQGPLDAVFCRNVMIYFDQQVRQALLLDVRRLLRPGGYLFVGHTESLNGMPQMFDRVESSVYRKP